MDRVVVVGGGIAGLASAYYLNEKAGGTLQITLLESNNYWGGKIITDRVDGFVIEGGPDTFVVTKPWGVRLCEDLGITGRLRGTNPDAKKTYILKNDRLHELPGGLTMMIPTEFGPMIRTRLLSWPAKVRMGMDFFLPSQEVNGDESLGAFVSRRLGRAAYENLIEPLMSGIYAGDGDSLSLQATFPYLRDLEVNQGGLVKGALHVRKQRLNNGKKPPPGSRSLFLTPLSGLTEIVESLVGKLESAGVDMRLQTYVQDVSHVESGYQINLGDGETIQSAGLILATPAFVSGNLLSRISPSLAKELKAIDYVSTATVTLAYKESDLVRPLDGYGYVIPRRENRKALACTWTSTKFPHRAPDGFALVRVFIGRAGQEGEISWEDESLLAIAREELNLTLGIKAEPILQRVFRWENAMPQYNIGHPARMARIEDILQKFPGLCLAGNGYRGIGIPDCIHSGEIGADRVLESLPVR